MTDLASHQNADATAPQSLGRGGIGHILAILLSLLALVAFGIPGLVIFMGILTATA